MDRHLYDKVLSGL